MCEPRTSERTCFDRYFSATIDQRGRGTLGTHLSLGGSELPGAPSDGQHRGKNALFIAVEIERAVGRERAGFDHVCEEAFGDEA